MIAYFNFVFYSSPAAIYLFQVNNGSSGTMSEIFSKFTIKRHYNDKVVKAAFTHYFGVSVVDFEPVNASLVITTKVLILLKVVMLFA